MQKYGHAIIVNNCEAKSREKGNYLKSIYFIYKSIKKDKGYDKRLQ